MQCREWVLGRNIVPVEATVIRLSRSAIDWDIYGLLWKADTKLERELIHDKDAACGKNEEEDPTTRAAELGHSTPSRRYLLWDGG